MDPVKNFGFVAVSTGYDELATSIVLSPGDGAKLPDPIVDGGYNVPWYDSTNYQNNALDPNVEIVRVIGPAGTGDTKTIVRAQEGTVASTKNTTDAIYVMLLGATAKTITDIPLIKLDDFGDPDDNMDLDFNTIRHGLTPKGTNLGHYLKDDGTWNTPSGSGDMLRSVYDSNDNGIVDTSETLHNVGGNKTYSEISLEIDTDIATHEALPNVHHNEYHSVASHNDTTVTGAELNADHSKLLSIEPAADVTDSINVAASGAMMDSDISDDEGFLRKISANTYEAMQSNLTAIIAPTVNDDSGDGYKICSMWIDIIADKAYICLDNTLTAAVWTEITQSGGGAVTSVFTRTGAVVAGTNDYTWAQIDKTISDIANITTRSHLSLTEIGSNTHTDIDAHLAAFNPHHGSAASGVNSDIIQLSGLLTDLSIAQGGTGQSSAQAAIDALSQVGGAANEHVLTKDTTTGNATFKAAASGFVDPMTTRGDIIIRDALNNTNRFGIGTTGQAIMSNGIDIVWNTPSGLGDMTKAVYDVDEDGVVDEAETLTDEGGTKTYAQIASEIDSDISTHATLITTHGVSGTILGTSDNQIITNKTIDSDTSPYVLYCYNGSGAQIDARSVCRISADHTGTPEIVKAQADGESNASGMLVMVIANIANLASGNCIILGRIGGFTGLTVGNIQYLSSTAAGAIGDTPTSIIGEIVRIVGYAISTTEVFFNPDRTYIEIA